MNLNTQLRSRPSSSLSRKIFLSFNKITAVNLVLILNLKEVSDLIPDLFLIK